MRWGRLLQQSLLIVLFRTVIGQREQEAAHDPPLGIKGDTGIIAQIAVKSTCTFHVVSNRPRAHRPFCKTDDGPIQIAGYNPAVQILLTRNFPIDEIEADAQGPADHSGCQFDKGNAIVPLDHPFCRCRTTPG